MVSRIPIEWYPEFKVDKQTYTSELSNRSALRAEVKRGLSDIYRRYGGWMNEASSMYVLVEELEKLPDNERFLNHLKVYLPPLLKVYQIPWSSDTVTINKVTYEDISYPKYSPNVIIEKPFQYFIDNVDNDGLFSLVMRNYVGEPTGLDKYYQDDIKGYSFDFTPINPEAEFFFRNIPYEPEMVMEFQDDIDELKKQMDLKSEISKLGGSVVTTYQYDSKTSWLTGGIVYYFHNESNFDRTSEKLLKRSASFTIN